MAQVVSLRRLTTDRNGDAAIWLGMRELCCRTGNGGEPIPSERWPLFGEIWIAPYQRLVPQWSYVALADGRVVGYLTGCADSVRFSRWRLVHCKLPLLWHIAFGRFHAGSDGRRFLRETLGWERSAERCFPRPLRRELQQRFPAHLHMNVDAEHRGDGIGKRLVERYLDDLRQEQVTGVHLLCGSGPLEFYRTVGFRQLAVTMARGHDVYAMGLSL